MYNTANNVTLGAQVDYGDLWMRHERGPRGAHIHVKQSVQLSRAILYHCSDE
jgi:hypothetical protein